MMHYIMKYIKIIILVAVIASFISPIRSLGFFAEPDKYIHSMPFGADVGDTSRPKVEIPPVIGQTAEETAIENANFNEQSGLPDTASKIPDIKSAISYFDSSSVSAPWIIFFSGVLIVIITFVLLKIKKVL